MAAQPSHPRIDNPWGERTPFGRGAEWPDEVGWFTSASLLHSNGDGMDIAAKDGRIVGVRGDPRCRVNRGRLGPKDLFAWQANSSPDRLKRPLVREGDELRESDWDTAMGRIVARSKELLSEAGPDAFGF
jgi:ferredoxin-nitrate reductase